MSSRFQTTIYAPSATSDRYKRLYDAIGLNIPKFQLLDILMDTAADLGYVVINGRQFDVDPEAFTETDTNG